MYKCTECGSQWETNYCPTCARTIDRSASEAERAAAHEVDADRPIHVASAKPDKWFNPMPKATDVLRDQIALAQRRLTRNVGLGMAMVVVGLLITGLSFEAAKSAGGGTYVVTTGILVVGVLTSIKALVGFHKISKIERSITEKQSEQLR
jgi:hypothetical protein